MRKMLFFYKNIQIWDKNTDDRIKFVELSEEAKKSLIIDKTLYFLPYDINKAFDVIM